MRPQLNAEIHTYDTHTGLPDGRVKAKLVVLRRLGHCGKFSCSRVLQDGGGYHNMAVVTRWRCYNMAVVTRWRKVLKYGGRCYKMACDTRWRQVLRWRRHNMACDTRWRVLRDGVSHDVGVHNMAGGTRWRVYKMAGDYSQRSAP